ncbi:hypothetical protein GCM10027299_54500 [Larkinella ripae]
MLGAAILIPILLNIVVIDVSFQIEVGALTVAATCLVVLVLCLNRSTLKVIFAILGQSAPIEEPVSKTGIKTVALILGLLVLFFGLQSLLIQLAKQ